MQGYKAYYIWSDLGITSPHKVYLGSAIKQTYITELSFKGSILLYILALYSAFNMVARTTKLLTN